jgi:hypothetical protein
MGHDQPTGFNWTGQQQPPGLLPVIITDQSTSLKTYRHPEQV